MIFLALLVSFSFSYVMKIGDAVFDKQDFYVKYSKQEWEKATDQQKSKIIKDYIKRESAAIAAKESGFDNDPGVVKKLANIKKQLLVNYLYDVVVSSMAIEKKDILLSRKNLGKELYVHHLLVGYKGAALKDYNTRDSVSAHVLASELYDSLKNNLSSFESFVDKYSDDPGKTTGAGSLGWLSWGRTPMGFQSTVWSLDQRVLSKPISSPLGFHLAWVDSSRLSAYAFYDSSSYNYYALQSLFGINREKLKEESLLFDSEFLAGSDLTIHKEDLTGLLNLILKEKASLKSGERFNLVDFLKNLDERFLICTIKNKHYGLRWFLSEMELSGRFPDIKNYEDLVSLFHPLLLQKRALSMANSMGLEKTLYFKKRYEIEKNRVFYDSYLKNLVNSVSPPDSNSIKDYYLENLDEKYLTKERVVLSQIKLQNEDLADSLSLLLSKEPALFNALAEKFSVFNPSGFGKMESFEEGKYNYVGQKAFEMLVGDVSEKIKNPDRSFSIIRLDEKIPSRPVELKKVYKRIESLLIKRGQDNAKKTTFDGFYKNNNLILKEDYAKYNN